MGGETLPGGHRVCGSNKEIFSPKSWEDSPVFELPNDTIASCRAGYRDLLKGASTLPRERQRGGRGRPLDDFDRKDPAPTSTASVTPVVLSLGVEAVSRRLRSRVAHHPGRICASFPPEPSRSSLAT